MPVDLFSWRSLTEAVNKLPVPDTFVADLIFKKSEQHNAEYLDVEITSGQKKLAPFVSPVEQGVVVEKLGRRVDTLKFPSISLKKQLTAPELIGQRDLSSSTLYLPGGQNITDYKRTKIAQELTDLLTMTKSRIEWMACQALTGKITVSQENVEFEIDFGFPGAHKITLTTTARWGESNANIAKNLRDWKKLIQKKTGYPVDICIMGQEAADLFIGDTTVKAQLNNLNYKVGALQLDNTRYLGRYQGTDYYEYSQVYVDEDGAEQNMINDYAVIMTSSQAPNKRHFGLITDLDADAQVPAQYFSKQWIDKDPSAMWLLLKSRPLVVPHHSESVVYALVH